MKNIFFLLIGILCSCVLFAQAPNNLSYQATVRKSDGSLLTLTKVNFKFTILQTSNVGPAVYEETQSVMTNKDGLATLKIGAGTTTVGNFSIIDWSTGLYFVRTKIDITGGTNFLLFSVAQFSSVPYAFFATEAGSVDYAGVTNAPNVDSLQNQMDSLLKRLTLLEQAKGATGLSVTDVDGNIYPLIIVGNQVWMGENLRVSKFNDGTSLTEVKDISWNNRTDAIYCWPNNDSTTFAQIHAGMLYNGFTIAQNKNICPQGFRVPTTIDFEILKTNILLKVPDSIVDKNIEMIKRLVLQINGLSWDYSAGAESVRQQLPTTSVHFDALPLGMRADDVTNVLFPGVGSNVVFMTQTPFVVNGTTVALKYMMLRTSSFSELNLFQKFGTFIRCVKE